jgi:uncharacterized membrane protein
MTQAGAEEKETGRLEAFSDGVFAIAMTLLILDVKVPKPVDAASAGGLFAALGRQWPTYLAYLTSFATILVMWVNHHKLFRHIRRSNDAFLFLNGLLLLFVTSVPFPTSLVAEYLERPDARDASLLYAGTFVAIAIAFNLLWNYASRGGRLLGSRANRVEVDAITRQYRLGPVLYAVAAALAFYSVAASLVLCLLLALFFAFTGALTRVFGDRPQRTETPS